MNKKQWAAGIMAVLIAIWVIFTSWPAIKGKPSPTPSLSAQKTVENYVAEQCALNFTKSLSYLSGEEYMIIKSQTHALTKQLHVKQQTITRVVDNDNLAQYNGVFNTDQGVIKESFYLYRNQANQWRIFTIAPLQEEWKGIIETKELPSDCKTAITKFTQELSTGNARQARTFVSDSLKRRLQESYLPKQQIAITDIVAAAKKGDRLLVQVDEKLSPPKQKPFNQSLLYTLAKGSDGWKIDRVSILNVTL